MKFSPMIRRSSDSTEYPHSASASSHVCPKERNMGGCRFSQPETNRWIAIVALKVSPAEGRLDLNTIVTGVVIAMVLSGAC